MSDDYDRFWILDGPPEGLDTSQTNRINEASEAIGFPVVGIVDEESGGVIAYGNPEICDELVRRANGYIEPDLRLSLEPLAIIEHFDGEPAGDELYAAYEADPEGFTKECRKNIHDDALYRGWHDLCVGFYNEFTGKDYYA